MTSLVTTAAAAEGSFAGPRARWAIASVLAAMVLVVLDASIANIALPTLRLSLHVTAAHAVRVVTAYQLGLVTMLLPAAALGESLGFRRVFTVGVAVFTIASVLCALSPSLTWLLAARFVQGLGGAAIMALGVALLREIVPHDRIGAAIGWNALTVALSSAVGPTVGATILSIAPWPWLFAVNLPIGAGVLATARSLPVAAGTGRAVDFASIALNAGAFASLVVGAECAPSKPALAGMLVVGAVVLAAMLVRREAGRSKPLVPLDLLAGRSFHVSAIASILCFTGQTAGLVALPFYLQRAFGLTPLEVGLYLTPWPLTVALTGPIAGRLSDRLPTAWLCLAGGAFMAAGLGAAALCSPQVLPIALSLCAGLCGLGFGLFNVPNNRNMFLSAPRERSGAAGGLQGVARLMGQTAGAVLMTLLFSVSPLALAPRIGLAVGGVLTLAAGVTSLVRVGASRRALPTT
jgi:DHA2 family multidrug resistance protein-like MFS transporter